MNNENQRKFKKNNIIIIVIILATVFGMASGIVGELITKTYLLDNYYNIPFFGEINLSNGNYYKGSSLIIRDARKVIVEQDVKIIETINSVESSLVGIFKKQKKSKNNNKFDLNNYYQINQEVGQGLVITSDGWIITSFLPAQAGLSKQEDILDDYVVITKDKKIYTIDKIVSDSLTPFNFLRVKAKDFPVRRFAQAKEINNGQLVIAVNWDNKSWITRISDIDKKTQDLINSSDAFFNQISLIDSPSKEFMGSVLFNLAGDVVGLIDNQGRIEPINHLETAINSLLKNKDIKRVSLGVNYIDLSSLAVVLTDLEQESYNKGAIIYKNKQGTAVVEGSAADLAGLKEGDIIVSVDNIEINKNNNLTDVIQRFTAGDKIKIVYLRNGSKKEVEVELGEIKQKDKNKK